MDEQVAVIGREALGDPQAPRVVLGLVGEGAEIDWPEPLDVPEVEELVARQAEPLEIALARARLPPGRHEHRGRQVLETAGRFGDQVHEHEAVVRRVAPEGDLLTRRSPRDRALSAGRPRYRPRRHWRARASGLPPRTRTRQDSRARMAHPRARRNRPRGTGAGPIPRAATGLTLSRQQAGISMRISCGRAGASASDRNVGAPFSNANSSLMKLVRTVISRPYTR